jgi:hypothetical protein
MVPQSFIGIDKDGYLTICLQTKTRADYKGYAYQIDKLTQIMAVQTIRDPASPSGTNQWISIPGYFDGFEFWYKDISNEVMGAQPESFIICGQPSGLDGLTTPRITDGKWHHLLFSFNIIGAVTSDLPPVPIPPGGGAIISPTLTTACRAWMVLDNKDITDTALQHGYLVPNGITSPQLPGMGTNGVFPFGPNASFTRSTLGLGPNDIVPLNVWVRGFWGNPRDGLPRYESAAGVVTTTPYPVPLGDFNVMVYTSPIANAPHGSIDPKRPDNPDPAKDLDVPQYRCSGFSIPVAGHPIGIPASAHHLEHNTGVEMAELQIWVNQSVDVASIKQLFIDKNGKPVSPGKAEEALGKPDIKLHGSANWKQGKNTGSTGVDDDGNTISSGQFSRVAGIEVFKPEPELGK